jgi:WNK lysine deficient protein kinase
MHSSSKYSALLHYDDASGNEEEEGQAKNLRFGPGQSSSSRSPDTARQLSLARQQQLLQRQCSLSPQHGGRPRRRDDADGHHHHGRARNNNNRVMSRNRSMVDLRSQLLHRTLVEELNRRLFFNTVGAVENIGFRSPATTTTTTSSSSSSSAAAAARGRRSKGDDRHHQQYVML